MRTTLTLDEDVAAKLKAEARRTGNTFRGTVNDFLRRGLMSRSQPRPKTPFSIQPRDLGRSQPGVNIDNIGDLLERLEGPAHT